MNKSDTLETAINTIRIYNQWRRGDETIEQPDPRAIGEALDVICDMADNFSKLTPETIASALWNVSKLRHGMFTPMQFRQLCEDVLTSEMSKINTETNQSK